MFFNSKPEANKPINSHTKIIGVGINWFLNILFPKTCLSCRREGFYVCPECFTKIPVQRSISCHICGKRSPDGKTCPQCKANASSKLAGILVASDWNNLLVRQMIYECKYRFIYDLAIPMAGVIVAFLETTKVINLQADKLILVPVPLHKRRLSWRGFNQAEAMAIEVGQHLKIPVVTNLLVRSRHTSPQMDINDKNSRIKNVANAFLLNPDLPDNKKPLIAEQMKGEMVILIDDVCTTGSTLNECAKAIKPLGPKAIWGLVVARG